MENYILPGGGEYTIWGAIVSCPDPTLCGEKGLVNNHRILGPEKGIYRSRSQPCQNLVTIYRRNLEAPITMQVYVCHTIY